MNVELSIIVCSYNRSARLRKALASLCEQTLAQERFEVVVVDNNSTDDTSAVAQEFRGRFLNYQALVETTQGLSHARNLGWKSSVGRYVAFLDDDARASAGWCAGILRAFQSQAPLAVSVGGPIYPDYETPPPAWYPDAIEIRSWGDTPGYLDAEAGQYGFSGSNMAFPREVLEAYGGFSDHLGMRGDRIRLGEDTLLFSRLHADQPHFWYDPELIVYHLVTARNYSLGYRLRRAYEAGRARAIIEQLAGRERVLGRELLSLAFHVKELLKLPVSGECNRAGMVVRLGNVVKQAGYLFSG